MGILGKKATIMILQSYKGKKIGIWGFGKTGQSVLKYIAPFTNSITIIEPKPLSDEQLQLIKTHNAQLVPSEHVQQFLEYNDIIIPSPGVDLRPYALWSEKYISELALFGQRVTCKTIAITGSVGKTTVVTLLTQILNTLGKKAIAVGNIGAPMLDVLQDQDKYDIIVLELSSFQLEQPHHFAPSIAALTNLFPNHLDRHGDLAAYAQAKGQLFAHQTETDKAIVPMEFLDACIPYTKKQKVLWLSEGAYKDDIIKSLSDITFEKNWNLIFAILEQLTITPDQVAQIASTLHIPEHRFERVATHKGISFYNDSKSTIPEATLESITRCKKQPLRLFLGGISKGVDRSDLIKQLPKTVQSVLCFGKEAQTLHILCQKEGIISSCHNTLEDAWKQCMAQSKEGDIVLFSPAGASYDLFANYEERGKVFKQLVHNFIKQH